VGGRTEFTGPAAAPFWVQSREPGVVERVDHLPHIPLGRGEHLRDLGCGAALHRGQHDPCPTEPNPILGCPRDLDQPLGLLGLQRLHEHLGLTRHQHHLRRQPPSLDEHSQHDTITTPTFCAAALVSRDSDYFTLV